MYRTFIDRSRVAQCFTALIAGVLFASPAVAQLPEIQPRQRDAEAPPSKKNDPRDEIVVERKTTDESSDEQRRERAREGQALPEVEPKADVAEEQEFKANDVFLGVAVSPTEETGIYVSEVALNGPADKAGIQAGDIILSVDETAVNSLQTFQDTLGKLKPGTEGQIVVLRNERELKLPIKFVSHKTAGFRPDESGEYGLVEIEEPKACLGVILTTDSPDTEGVTIARVHPDCPAASDAGLEAGDIIYSINKTAVSTPAQVTALLSDLEPGAEITLLVRRDGERQMVTTTLADREKLLAVNTQHEDSADFADEATGHQLMLEQHKHFAKQHERLEDLTLQLLDEVKALRKEVNELKNGQTVRN